MTLQSNGTPVLVSTTATLTPSVTGQFPTGSAPLANHLIVAVAAIFGSTSATSITAPGGWTSVATINATTNLVTIYTKTATGSDSAPVFTGIAVGTAADSDMILTLYDISDPVTGNTPLFDASGTASGTTTLPAVTTSGNLTASGELAIACASIGQGTTTGANTWTTPSNWTLPAAGNAQTASARSQTAVYFTTNSTVLTSGSTATVTMVKTRTTTHTAAVIATFRQSGTQLGGMDHPTGIRVWMQRAGTVFATLLNLTPPPPPVITPATFYPLNHPAAARIRPFPPRGRTRGNPGIFDQTGVAIYGAVRSPSAQGNPSDVAANSVTAGNGARLATRGRTYGVSHSGIRNQTGPPVYPLHSSVAQGGTSAAVSKNGAALPARGRTEGRTGAFGQQGPPVTPQQRPAATRSRGLPPRGRTASQSGTFQGTGAPLTQLRRPVQARLPLPVRGRAQGRAGVFTSTAPVLATFYALGRPIAAIVRLLQPKGRTASRAGVYGQAGPPVTPLRGPVRTRITPPPRGRSQGRAGTFTSVTPVLAVFYPLPRPAAAVVRPQPIRGRTQGRTGVFAQAGPQVTPLQRPVQARQPLPVRGRAQWRYGTFTPLTSVTIFYALNRPASAVIRPLPRRGVTISRAGIFQGTGPKVTPLRGPVKARLPQQPPPKGQVRSNPGTSGQAGPPVTPLRGPVRASVRVFSPRGRAQGHAGVFRGSGPAVKPLQHPVYAWRPGPRRGICLTSVRPAPPVPNTAVPFPLHRPVQARRPLPPAGRTYRTVPYVPPFIPSGGHGYPYTAKLTVTRWSAFLTDGEWAASQKVPIRYSATSADARWPVSAQAGRWFTTSGPA